MSHMTIERPLREYARRDPNAPVIAAGASLGPLRDVVALLDAKDEQWTILRASMIAWVVDNIGAEAAQKIAAAHPREPCE